MSKIPVSYCFIVASSDDRIHLLEKMVLSFKKNRHYQNADVFLYYQGDKIHDFANGKFFKDIIVSPVLRGVFTPRYELIKRYCANYDYVILIDDDLALYEDTDYSGAMNFLDFEKKAGCCCISTHCESRSNKVENISDKMEYYNVEGGLVFPRRSIRIILDYFKDKEADYTEDVMWLLLYVKGYDLYKCHTSNAIHCCNRKTKDGAYTGFSKMRLEKPHVPMLTEWFESKIVSDDRLGHQVYKIKELKDINQDGIAERKRNVEGRTWQ